MRQRHCIFSGLFGGDVADQWCNCFLAVEQVGDIGIDVLGHDGYPVLVQLPGDGKPYAAGGTGDDGDFAVEAGGEMVDRHNSSFGRWNATIRSVASITDGGKVG